MGGGLQGRAGDGLNYQSIGSGGGIAQIKAKTVTFGATDKPLTSKELGGRPDPVSGGDRRHRAGGQCPGVAPGQLVLDGPTLAAIFLGKISRWDDPAIKKLNPGVNLPGRAIAVVHRSDGRARPSSSPPISAASARTGRTMSAPTPRSTGRSASAPRAMKASPAMSRRSPAASAMSNMPMPSKTTELHQDDQQGRQDGGPDRGDLPRPPRPAPIGSAPPKRFYVCSWTARAPTSWPITATTFVLIYKQPPDPAAAAEALKFFKWGFEKGDQLALGLDYVPLPDNAVKAIEASWKGIQGSGM